MRYLEAWINLQIRTDLSFRGLVCLLVLIPNVCGTHVRSPTKAPSFSNLGATPPNPNPFWSFPLLFGWTASPSSDCVHSCLREADITIKNDACAKREDSIPPPLLPSVLIAKRILPSGEILRTGHLVDTLLKRSRGKRILLARWIRFKCMRFSVFTTRQKTKNGRGRNLGGGKQECTLTGGNPIPQ